MASTCFTVSGKKKTDERRTDGGWLRYDSCSTVQKHKSKLKLKKKKIKLKNIYIVWRYGGQITCISTKFGVNPLDDVRENGFCRRTRDNSAMPVALLCTVAQSRAKIIKNSNLRLAIIETKKWRRWNVLFNIQEKLHFRLHILGQMLHVPIRYNDKNFNFGDKICWR